MDASSFMFASDQATTAISRGRVDSISDDGVVFVHTDSGTLPCEQLTSGDRPVALAIGDQALVWHTGRPGEMGVVLGRIGALRAPAPARAPDDVAEAPESIVLEAKHSLTLRVGDGSITIREDGRILIKGKDLVSHAQRLNRIKGGAVSIN